MQENVNYEVASDPLVSIFPDIDVSSAQAVLQWRREGLHQRLLNGASGSETVSGFTDLVDDVLIGRYQNIAQHHGTDVTVGIHHCCLIAVGGYGRKELSPYSDIDVMVLYRQGGEKIIQSLASGVFHHLWDLGFQVGHSVRSIHDCLVVAGGDLAAKTALMESRFLAGGVQVFKEFQRRFSRQILGRRVGGFIRDKIEEREREYTKFGETVYLLEPNIKKTKGGLRDLHLLQWVGMAKYQAATLQELANRGVLAHQDYIELIDAREFLWKVRALLHLHAGRAQEILSFEDQVRLTTEFGFYDQPHLLGVEQFMQQYYRHTTGVYGHCVRFIDRARSTSISEYFRKIWPSPLVEGYFKISGSRLSLSEDKLVQVLDKPELLLRLFRIAQERGLTIDGVVLEEIHRHMENVSDNVFCSPPVSKSFRQILSGPTSVSKTLVLMHQARVLEKLVPAFSRVRGLMQFNQYHKYTVDEHSLLAVRQVECLGSQGGVLTDVYKEIHQKDLLHLAILLHDVGKGLPDDHSEVGKKIAHDMATRLKLDQQEYDTLEFLVYQHLLMANTAFRRDIYDDKVLLTFSRRVGTPDMLKKLLLLTAADIAAVGPDMLTKWKESLLIELYLRTLPEVSGDKEVLNFSNTVKQLASKIIKSWKIQAAYSDSRKTDENTLCPSQGWIEEQLETFPLRYLSGTSSERIISHLQVIQHLTSKDLIVQSAFDKELKVCEYSLIAYDSVMPGIFMHVTGVLAAWGLQVLDAQIFTRSDGIVVDAFYVEDKDFKEAPTQRRLSKVSEAIIRVLRGEESIDELIKRNQRVDFGHKLPLHQQITEVKIDNEISDQFTVIDVFAQNKQGLLYVMARTLFRLGLSIHAAKIGTRLDQVVDVFHVTGKNGGKIDNLVYCEKVQKTLQEEVDQFLKFN